MEKDGVTPSIDSPLPMGAAMHHRLIDSKRITRSNDRTSLASGNASTCYSFNSNRVPQLRSVSSVRPISPPPCFFPSFALRRMPPLLPPKPQNSDHSHVFYSMSFFSLSFSFLPSEKNSLLDEASTRANRNAFNLSLIAYCANRAYNV